MAIHLYHITKKIDYNKNEILFPTYFQEVKVTITGNTGHALNFVENTCVEKLHRLMTTLLAIRDEEKAKLSEELQGSQLGLVTTLNITMINVKYVLVFQF